MSRVVYEIYIIIPYTQKFSPGENVRQFRLCLSLAKIFSAKFLSSEKYFTLRGTNSDQPFFWRPLLARCRYYLIFKLHLGGTYSILQDRYHQSSAISEVNAAVNRAAQRGKESKKRGACITLDETAKIRISEGQRGASLWSYGMEGR